MPVKLTELEIMCRRCCLLRSSPLNMNNLASAIKGFHDENAEGRDPNFLAISEDDPYAMLDAKTCIEAFHMPRLSIVRVRGLEKDTWFVGTLEVVDAIS